MTEPKKNNSKIIIPILIVCLALLTIFYFWDMKSNRDKLFLAEQKAAQTDSLLQAYRQTDKQLVDIIAKYDTTFSLPKARHEIPEFLDALFFRLERETLILTETGQQQQTENGLLNYANDTLRQAVQSLEGKVMLTKSQIKAATDQTTSLTSRLFAQKITFDSLSKAFNQQLQLAKNATPDSLRLVSPQGVNLYYYGKVKQNQPSGFGIGFYEGKGYYIGEWEANARSGYGKHFYKDGSIYEGNFKEDLREGYGTYYYHTGQVYRGNWKQNLMNGTGEISETNGKSVIGTWKDGKLSQK